MRRHRPSPAWLLAGLLVGGAGMAAPQDGAVPPIPETPVEGQFPDAPAPWRDYLVQARAAERIADPLARCLAYPDLPGNQWPAGHAEAHCRVHAHVPIPLAELAAYVDEGRLEALDARFAAILARHFSPDDFSEEIHYVLEVPGEAGDRLTAKWVALAPDSAYAHYARGAHLLVAARAARGGRWASQTPPEAMRRMSALIGESIASLERAIALEPRLLPAYALLHNAAMFDSREDVERRAAEAAWAIDPACLDMAKQRMEALEPRWGGSYMEMLAFAKQLEPFVAERPGLAVHVAAPWGDRGDRLVAQDVYTREAAEVLATAVAKGSNEFHLLDAAEVAFNRTDAAPDAWMALAHLLQVTRFREGPRWAEQAIAELFVRSEPAWSLARGRRALAMAERSEPAELPRAHYFVGAASNNLGLHDDAQRHYLAAAASPAYFEVSLQELASMWLFHDATDPAGGAAKAAPFIDRLLAADPESGYALLLRLEQLAQQGEAIPLEVLRALAEHGDPDDPRQRDGVAQARQLVAEAERAMAEGWPDD